MNKVYYCRLKQGEHTDFAEIFYISKSNYLDINDLLKCAKETVNKLNQENDGYFYWVTP